MTPGRWVFTGIAAATILGLGLAGPDRDADGRLTRATTVALDFHDRPVA